MGGTPENQRKAFCKLRTNEMSDSTAVLLKLQQAGSWLKLSEELQLYNY